MASHSSDQSPRTSLTWLLYGIFFASGISGLMYEVVWVRMLTRILGSTSYATSTVLAVFMAGLGLGSLIAGRFVDRARSPLAWYAILELGIGATALVSLALPDQLVPLYRLMYDSAAGSRATLTIGQVMIAVIVLLPPTALMGATLPTLCAYGARHVRDFSRCAGTLYAVNTLGAVIGVLASGFFFLGSIGETNTIFAGAVLNLLAALVAYQMSKSTGPASVAETSDSAQSEVETTGAQFSPFVRWIVLATFFASGFIALANEVLWGRMLILCQGTSIYAFSSMLAVVLAGIGIGSWVMGAYVNSLQRPLVQLARVQLGIAVAAFAALYLFGIFGSLPRPSLRYGTNLIWLVIAPMILMGPMALLWGATFPLCVRCFSQATGRAGRDVSILYVGNTLGSILGAVVAGFWLIGRWGVSTSATGLAIASACIGVVIFLSQAGRMRLRLVDLVLVGISAIAWLGVGDPYYQVIEDRIQPVFQSPPNVYAHYEEATGTTTAFGLGFAPSTTGNPQLNTYRQLWVNGQGMTVMCTEAKMMAHLPIALVEDPSDVLIICFGMGTTLRSASLYDDIETTAVELLPGVVKCFSHYHANAQEILNLPHINVEVDDGRNYLLMHDKKFDVVTIDPAPPFFSAGTVNLYTREFFELVKSRLKPGGLLCLWIPPENKVEVRMVLRTFLDVFPHTDVWGGAFYKGLYLMGSEHKIENAEEKIRAAYQNARMRADVTEWDTSCESPEKVLELHVTDGETLSRLYEGVATVTDDHPYTEFPLLRVLDEHNPPELNADTLRSDLAELDAEK